MEHGPHIVQNVSVYVNFEGILCDLLLDLERSLCFCCQGSNWAQLISVVFLLVDQNDLPYFELAVCQFDVDKRLRQRLLVVQRMVDK